MALPLFPKATSSTLELQRRELREMGTQKMCLPGGGELLAVLDLTQDVSRELVTRAQRRMLALFYGRIDGIMRCNAWVEVWVKMVTPGAQNSDQPGHLQVGEELASDVWVDQLP